MQLPFFVDQSDPLKTHHSVLGPFGIRRVSRVYAIVDPKGNPPANPSAFGKGAVLFVPVRDTEGEIRRLAEPRMEYGFHASAGSRDVPVDLVAEEYFHGRIDWFVVPFTVPIGAVASVRGLVVTDVFGERTWISPAISEDWKLFRTSVAGGAGGVAGHDLTILDTADHIQESAPLDEVVFVRDEMANLVWAIEKTVLSPVGAGMPEAEAGHELRDFERGHGHPPAPPPPAEGTHVRYEVMTSVPENWIPMVPMHRPGDNREIQLRRAAMPRTFDGDPSPPTPVTLGSARLPASAPGPHIEGSAPGAGGVVLGSRRSMARSRFSIGYSYSRYSPHDSSTLTTRPATAYGRCAQLGGGKS